MFPVIRQTWTVLAVLINIVTQGMVLSYTSILLPDLRAKDSEIKVDLNMISWLGGSVGLAGIPGFIVSAFLMDWIGRRRAHAIVIIPGVLGWLVVYFAADVKILIAGRFLCGFTSGATVCLGAVVIGEYTSPSNRGTFLNLKTAAFCLGGTITHLLGHFYNWRTVALIANIPHFISLCIIYTWPESPAWLAFKREFESSEKSFYWLRGKSEETEKELKELIQAQKEKPVNNNATLKEQFKAVAMKFTRKDFIKPLIIIILCAFLIEFSGRHIFPAYALQIIEEVIGDKSHSLYYTLAIDIIITVSATFSSVLVKYYKRRAILFTTGFSALFILFTVCAYLYLSSNNLIPHNYSIIPIALFVLYFILINLGSTTIPLSLMGEVFPLAHRAVGTAALGIVLSFLVMVALHVTPYLLDSIRVHGTFAVFGLILGLTLLFFYFILPETKDRTLQEIENYFKTGRFEGDDETVDDDDDLRMKMIS